MATRQIPERAYTALHLKQLMDETRSWARSWDDILRYLQDSATTGTWTMPQLADDVRHLKNDNVRFTTDYRRMWQALTGENAEPHLTPATGEDSKASSRVLDVLRRVESKEYREMSRRMASSGGAAWDNQQL